MTSDQDTKVVAEPQVQQVQEAKDNTHLVSFTYTDVLLYLLVTFMNGYSCNSESENLVLGLFNIKQIGTSLRLKVTLY